MRKLALGFVAPICATLLCISSAAAQTTAFAAESQARSDSLTSALLERDAAALERLVLDAMAFVRKEVNPE